jgi:putative phosphoribosyl transferase
MTVDSIGTRPLERELTLVAGSAKLAGTLDLPSNPAGVVLFAHGSGSSRHSPRNTRVAHALNGAGVGTLLFDLLTPEEDRTYETRFDIALLTSRLLAATDALADHAEAVGLPVGYFGASTGAAAALRAAAAMGSRVAAVVSRGGRPDLAGPEALARVRAPTLLIVGGCDDVVLELNREAHSQLSCEKRLLVVPGATHLFEEPGTLDQVAQAAARWFSRWLVPARAAPA